MSKYSHLIAEGIIGNPDDLSVDDFHRRASYQLRAVVHAAYQGRASVLFAAVGVQQWGTFDP